MKTLLKRLLAGSPYLRALVLIRDLVNATVATFIVGALGILPRRLLVAVKQDLVITERMDYVRGEILLTIDSLVEYATRLHSCKKEPETIRWIEEFIRPRDVVFDIGANVGAYSLVVDKSTMGTAKVYAFEPSFASFAQLNRNLLLNRCAGRIVPLMFALSDTTGLDRLNYSSILPGAALHALGEAFDNKGQAFQPEHDQLVLACRLDDLVEFAGIEPPSHIKLDVDGGELGVLLGAERILSGQAVKSILVEMEPGIETSLVLQRYLEGKGFRVHSSYPHGMDSTATHNYIFVREGFTAESMGSRAAL